MVLRPEELEGSQCCLFQPFNPQDAAVFSEPWFWDCFMVSGLIVATANSALHLAQTGNLNTTQFTEHRLSRHSIENGVQGLYSIFLSVAICCRGPGVDIPLLSAAL